MERNWVLETCLPFDPVTDEEALIKEALVRLRNTASKKGMGTGGKRGYYSALVDELNSSEFKKVESLLLDYDERHRMADEAKVIVYEELDKLAEVNPDAVTKIRKAVRMKVRAKTGIPDWDISEEAVSARIAQLNLQVSFNSGLSGNPDEAYERYCGVDTTDAEKYEQRLKPLLTTLGVTSLYAYLESRGVDDVYTTSDASIIESLKLFAANPKQDSKERIAAEKDLCNIGLEIVEGGKRPDYDALLVKRGIDSVLLELDLVPEDGMVSASVACRQVGELVKYVPDEKEAALLLLGSIQRRGLTCAVSFDELVRMSSTNTAKTQANETTSFESAEEIKRRARERVHAREAASKSSTEAEANMSGGAESSSGSSSNAGSHDDTFTVDTGAWRTADYSIPEPYEPKERSKGEQHGCLFWVAIIFAAIAVINVGSCTIRYIISPKPDTSAVIQVNTSYEGELFPAAQTQKGAMGYIGVDGSWVIKPQFEEWGYFNEGFAREKDTLTGDWGFINGKGEWVIEPTYKSVGDFHDGRAWVEIDGGFSYIDESGAIVIPGPFKKCSDFGDGYAWVTIANDTFYGYKRYYGIIDTSGNVIVEQTEVETNNHVPGAFHEGLSVIYQDYHYGFADISGSIVIGCKFTGASAFGEGMAAVKSAETKKWGYIDKTGRTVLQDDFKSATNFHDGFARVQKSDGSYFLMDTSGSIVDKQFENCDLFSSGVVSAKSKNGEFGLFDTSGSLVFDARSTAVLLYSYPIEVYEG